LPNELLAVNARYEEIPKKTKPYIDAILENIQDYSDNEDLVIFGKYLISRIGENMTPLEWHRATENTLQDLEQGVNRYTLEKINPASEEYLLVGRYASAVYDNLKVDWLNFLENIFPKDFFADKIKRYIEREIYEY